MTRTGPLPGPRRRGVGASRHDRGLAAAQDNQAVRDERLQGVSDDAGPDALQSAQLGDRGQFVAWDEGPGPDGRCERLRDLLPGGTSIARVDGQGWDVAVLGERPAGAGQVAAALPTKRSTRTAGRRSVTVTERSGRNRPQV